MKIATYIRFSTDSQDLKVQKEEIDKFVSKLSNVDTVIEYVDEGLSGKDINRPALQRLLNDMKEHKFDTIVFLKLDRLSRSLQDILVLFKDFEDNKISVMIVKENIDTQTSMGKMFFHLIGMFAEFERSVIAERLHDGKEYAKLHGTRTGKPMHRPKKVVEDIKELKNLYSKGVSINKLAKMHKMNPTTMRRILCECGAINKQ